MTQINKLKDKSKIVIINIRLLRRKNSTPERHLLGLVKILVFDLVEFCPETRQEFPFLVCLLQNLFTLHLILHLNHSRFLLSLFDMLRPKSIKIYLDFLKVLANISRFFSLLQFMVSVFLFLYCSSFYNFSINYCSLNCRLLWAFMNFYWLDFLDVSDCDRLCCLCSKMSLWLVLILFTDFSMYFCYFSLDF